MKYFELDEFRCPCCKENDIKRSFALRLDKARRYADAPFVISSGYRCPEHNKEVGGSETSSHLSGLAVDIVVKGSRHRYRIVAGLIQAGFNRIGIGKGFIHVDYDIKKPGMCIWVY